MSFTSDVKQEALHLTLKPCCEVAFLSAVFAVNGHLKLSSSGIGLRIQTTQLPLARKIIGLVKKRYGLELEIRISQQVKLKKKKMFTLTIQESATKMIHELGLMEEDLGFASKVDETITQKDCDYGAYLRGAFVTSGSINHPQSSSYHLEMASQNASYAESLTALLNKASLNAKTLEKKTGQYITYIKESEKIADFLRLIGTHQALFTFEDERIKRDFYNSITRVLNMELANQNKTLEAADKQLKNIAIVENLLSQEDLSDGVKQAMMLRKTYPEASLNELADKSLEHFPKAISKSGLNHRFRQLDGLAEKAMEGYHDQRHRR